MEKEVPYKSKKDLPSMELVRQEIRKGEDELERACEERDREIRQAWLDMGLEIYIADLEPTPPAGWPEGMSLPTVEETLDTINGVGTRIDELRQERVGKLLYFDDGMRDPISQSA